MWNPDPGEKPMSWSARFVVLVILGILVGVLLLWVNYQHPNLKCKVNQSTQQCQPSPSPNLSKGES